MLHDVDHRDVRINLNGLAVQYRRLVAPLLYGFPGGRKEYWITGYDLQGPDGTVRSDDGPHFHAAFSARLSGEHRIHWFHAPDQHAWIELRFDDSRPRHLVFGVGGRRDSLP